MSVLAFFSSGMTLAPQASWLAAAKAMAAAMFFMVAFI